MIIRSQKYWMGALGAAAAALLLCGGFDASAQSNKVTKKEEPAEPQTTARQHFMQGKLVISQEILQGVVLSDFKLIEKGATGLNLLTLGEEWGFNNTKDYARMSEDLRRISKQLVKAAREKNSEAATLGYQRLTLNCVECHQALRGGFKE
jgi:hypothetical protein